MTALWDTTGAEVARALAAARRSGGLTSGLALTLVAVVDEQPGSRGTPVQAVEDACTVAAAAHPCRLLLVTRSPVGREVPPDRLDAEVVVGGRLGPCEAVTMRMQGRLSLHAESVMMPLLAPDVPVVTWWHGPPPERISTDPLGVVAERRITDCALAGDPVAALRQRAVDYAAGDTDLTWTRTTGWRTLLAGALDSQPEHAPPPPTAATVTSAPADASAALLTGWLAARLGITPTRQDGASGEVESVQLELADDGQIAITRSDGTAVLHRTGEQQRRLPMATRSLGDELAEELRELHPDQPYAAALSAATGVPGLAERPAGRVHTWVDPAEGPANG